MGVLALLWHARAGAEALQPPRLAQPVEAVYPEEARAAGLAARVLLQLTLDAEGRVQEAVVVEPAGHGFDAAAREAALRLRFEPARRAGRAVAAKIRHAFAFRPPVLQSAPQAPATQPSAAADLTVYGARNTGALQLLRSAEAVNVIDTRRARQQTADLGEVLARSQGVAVRRDGGLGSAARFSLGGLYDEQVRFFLDGVPLDVAGYPFGIANVPVNLIERVEVYRGVVPVRFGADALGGAVNLASDRTYDSRLSLSYQLGSFGTHRLTLDARHRDEPTGVVLAATGFVDVARNDYEVDVELADARGRLSPARVPRFHDGYRAHGVALEVGVVDRPWARRLVLRALASGYDKELQSNIVMTVPYGEVTYGTSLYGANLSYEVGLRDDLELSAVVSYAHRSVSYRDDGRWVYDWRGQRVRERSVAGEVEGRPHDQLIWQHNLFARALLDQRIAAGHQLRASITPSASLRSGDERLPSDPAARDPLAVQRELFTLVSGLEYEASALDERVSNVLFVKDYYYQTHSQEVLTGGALRERESTTHRLGVGDALRVRATGWLYAKASYEYATRLPSADEVFGNGVLVQPNLALEPEVSHNANLGPRIELTKTALGDLTLDLNGFVRLSDRLIVLLGNDRHFTYQNVFRARNLGVESALSWTSPGRWLSLDGMLTWQDLRNVARDGTFGAFAGDRVPNRPYLFGSWGARVRVAGLPGTRDTLEPFYNGRYVHAFFRSWESQGLRESKQVIDAQVTHSLGIAWTVQQDFGRLITTLEIDNLADARLFDNYGAERPGRAFYLKLVGELR